MLRQILIYVLGFRRRRAARARLERLGNSPEDWARPMSHQTGHPFMPHGDDEKKRAELHANYVPSWAKPEK
jgi:hypothetical protein